MSMRKVVSVAVSLLLLPPLIGGPASATDLDWRNGGSLKDEPPILVPRYSFSWTGFYLGGHFGYGWGDNSIANVDGDGLNGTDGFSIHPSGFLGGIQAGYNWQFDGALFGLEGDLGILGADDEERTGTAFVDTEYGGYGTLTGRLGFIQNRWLFYVKGGLAIADIETKAGALSGGDPVPGDFTDLDETRLGYAVGGGAEYGFHPNWSMKFEYLYMNFSEDHSGNDAGDSFRHENDLHTVKVGINYRFQPAPTLPLR